MYWNISILVVIYGITFHAGILAGLAIVARAGEVSYKQLIVRAILEVIISLVLLVGYMVLNETF